MILDLLFPNRCVRCDYIIPNDALVCNICKTHINFTHFQYGSTTLLKQKCSALFPLKDAFALLKFENDSLSREIVHQLKYSGREKIGKILAEWTISKIDFQDSKPDLLITVPLHPKKEKERGYNQLHLFANTLSEHWNIPHDAHAVERKDFQKAQALKKKKERNETTNLFQLKKEIKNKHILLIDDVFTTGNTLSKIAWELLTNNSNTISVLVIALD